MPESNDVVSIRTITIDSIKTMHHHKHTFTSLFFLLTLPLSLLTFSLSFSTLSTTHNILHLESIASLTPTRFEARQILKETRADAYSIFLTKSLYFSLSFPLSLIATASSVSTAAAKPSPLKISFPRLLATSIVTYAVLLLYSITTRVASTIISTWFPSFGLGLVMFLIGSGFEIYLMCVTSIGLVVSILEEKVGLKAIRVGLNIIEGRKVVGWVISAMGVAVFGLDHMEMGNGRERVWVRVWEIATMKASNKVIMKKLAVAAKTACRVGL